eukprot:370348_1
MADLALDYFLEANGIDNNESRDPQDDDPNIEKHKPQPNEPNDSNNNEIEETPLQLLRSLYQRDEEAIQKRHEPKQKIKLKRGCIVDVFSSSKQRWIQGIVIQIKGDTLCVMYGNKKK